MITYSNSFNGKRYLEELKNLLNKWQEKENINIKERIYIGFVYGPYRETNIYYCKTSCRKLANFIKNNFENENGKIRCFSFFKNPKYDIYIEIGYIDNLEESEYISESILKVFFSIVKAYMIVKKGYYYPLEIYKSFLYNNIR